MLASETQMARLVEVDVPAIDALLGMTRLFGQVRGLYPAAPTV